MESKGKQNNSITTKSKLAKSNLAERLTTYIFYASVFIFLLAFNFRDSMTGGWYQQWLPTGLGDAPVKDMVFTDSLTGYIIAGSPYLLKTTNGGDNWFISQNFGDTIMLRNIQFVNKDSAIISETNSIYKSTNAGTNWTRIVFPGYPYNTMYAFCMHALNFDTIYLGGGDGFSHPQLYFTTNGGINWIIKYQASSGGEFDKVYFYNKDIGFCCTSNQTLKTTDGGNNWFQVLASEGYTDIHFVDSLVGWKAGGYIKKTTNGGLNWFIQPLPTSNWISAMSKISVLNKDTIWGIGGAIQWIPSTNHFRGIVYRTTNGGNNWGYQIPDTSIDSYIFINISFLNKNNGWVYDSKDFHTKNGGGDTTFFTGINDNGTIISNEFILYQNYPNPFNSMTNVKVQMLKQGFAEVKIFDLTGKLIKVLLKQKLNAGEHSIKFNASNLTSGVYFYTLFVDGNRINTKKMLMIK